MFFRGYVFSSNEKLNSLYVYVDKIKFSEEDLIKMQDVIKNKDVYLVFGTEIFNNGNSYKIFFVDNIFLKKEFRISDFRKENCLISKRLKKENDFINILRRFLKENILLEPYKEFDDYLYSRAVFLSKEIENKFLLTIRPQFLKIELDNPKEIEEAKKDILNYFISKYNKKIYIYSPYEHKNKFTTNFIKLILFFIVLSGFYFIFLSLFLFKFISDILKIFIKKYFCYHLIGFSKIHIFISLFFTYFLFFLASFVLSLYMLKEISLDIYVIFLSLLISVSFLMFLFLFVYKREYVNNRIFN